MANMIAVTSASKTFKPGDKVVYEARVWTVTQHATQHPERVSIISRRTAYERPRRIEIEPERLTPYDPSAKKNERAGKALTCQCCGGSYLAKKGLIAHHGYQRPGYGNQTASCYGARNLPFEESRDCLGEMIRDILKPDVKRLIAARRVLLSDPYHPVLGFEYEPLPKNLPLGVALPRIRKRIGPDHADYLRARHIAIQEINLTTKHAYQHLQRQRLRYRNWKP